MGSISCLLFIVVHESLYISGMMLSSSVWGKMADQFGRRVTLILTSAFLAYFGLVTAFAPSFGWVLFLRFLVGIFIGGVPQVSKSNNYSTRLGVYALLVL